MKNDIQLDIAVGNSRKQKIWKNKQIYWSELVEKLSGTVRTPETLSEYKKMPKSKQDDIKDVGGFVGGYLVKGRRSNVKYRQIIALDIDFGDMGIWDGWSLIYGCASCIYSTHKHDPSHPRLRLIIPLDRKVSPDEYQAIARKVADNLDIDAFDDTTYQPQRLMYWPSTSSDGEYVFETIDADFIRADDVLNEYEDWSDITSWPAGKRAGDVVKKGIRKQKNPLEKTGIVGAFCRSYSIDEAIETFIDDYAACDIDNRYTYTKGSTSAGVITYDGMFSYSHHGTDPASGVLCNAFDLVRLHRFKEFDEDVKESTPAHKLSSFIAMEELAASDRKVKKEIVRSMNGVSSDDFDDESDWEEQLEITKKGQIMANYHNMELILDNDPYFKEKLGYDELANREVALCDVPWRKITLKDNGLRDIDDANIRSYFDQKYNLTGKDKIYDCVQVVCRKHSYHPIRQYLESLEWDGIRRIDTLMIDYFACEDNEYTRAVTRKTLLGAVTRVYEPGCQFDTMLVLKGEQGCGKSSFFRKLGKSWFTDSLKDIKNKDALEALQGIWIVEFGELTAMKKADAETIKSFLSGTTDRFRKAYGRRTENYPRQCIFVATTNENEFLRDKTGNRRFWIVGSRKSIKPARNVFELTDNDFDQFWAEAKALYDAGTESLILSEELEKEAVKVQESYMLEDPKEQIIVEYLNRLLPENWDDMDIYDRQAWIASDKKGTVERDRVCAAEVWCEALGHDDTKKLDSYQTSEINKIIARQKNWENPGYPIRIKNYGSRRGFYRLQTDCSHL